MAELCVMDMTGDSKTIWDPSNADEVAAARATFDTLKKKRYLAYKVKADGEKGELISDFDPTAGKIIMSPMMAGG
jgi:hypothetical protein